MIVIFLSGFVSAYEISSAIKKFTSEIGTNCSCSADVIHVKLTGFFKRNDDLYTDTGPWCDSLEERQEIYKFGDQSIKMKCDGLLCAVSEIKIL